MTRTTKETVRIRAFIYGYHGHAPGLAALQLIYTKPGSHPRLTKKALTTSYAAGVVAKRRREQCPCPQCFCKRHGIPF